MFSQEATPETAPVATESAPATAPNAPTVKDSTVWIFTLIDGSQLMGRIQKEEGGQITLLLLDGQTRTFFRADVGDQQEKRAPQNIKVVRGKLWTENPNRTRHLWSPSAMPLRAGEGYIAQKQLLFTTWAHGITDNIAILLGSILPANFMGPDYLNIIAAAKFSKEVSPKVFVGAGFESLIISKAFFNSDDMGDGMLSVGVAFATLTYGEPDAQVTINIGKPFAFDSSNAATGDILISVSAMWRFSRHYGLVSENIFVPGIDTGGAGWGVPSLHGLVWRSIREETSWDLGFIMPGGVPSPIPWFEWTWHLGD